jgi:hypothetical protein
MPRIQWATKNTIRAFRRILNTSPIGISLSSHYKKTDSGNRVEEQTFYTTGFS